MLSLPPPYVYVSILQNTHFWEVRGTQTASEEKQLSTKHAHCSHKWDAYETTCEWDYKKWILQNTNSLIDTHIAVYQGTRLRSTHLSIPYSVHHTRGQQDAQRGRQVPYGELCKMAAHDVDIAGIYYETKMMRRIIMLFYNEEYIDILVSWTCLHECDSKFVIGCLAIEMTNEKELPTPEKRRNPACAVVMRGKKTRYWQNVTHVRICEHTE
jgi:hypothetical protein